MAERVGVTKRGCHNTAGIVHQDHLMSHNQKGREDGRALNFSSGLEPSRPPLISP